MISRSLTNFNDGNPVFLSREKNILGIGVIEMTPILEAQFLSTLTTKQERSESNKPVSNDNAGVSRSFFICRGGGGGGITPEKNV